MTIGIMDVTLVGARGLKNADFLGKIDPYVLIQYKNQEHKSRKASGQGSAPLWNEKFRFKVEFPNKGKIEQQKLVLKIMDRDTFTRDDFLGQTTIYLKELFETGMEEGKAELKTQKYRVVSANQTYHGEINVGVTFTAQGETNNNEQDFGGWKENTF
ncbi:16 kDa phloem protein 1-like [Primulina eburnea]|uniref:16 kDa phloem protein 1-like n=1 Tax=Primulina eburnea TaxID=1245227 RepID=UPI003C6C92E0